MADKTEQAIGTALPGVILILIACVAPVELFKLLAFVDPNTSSGAALRPGLVHAGGLRGLLSGGDADTGPGGDADRDGRPHGEAASEDTTDARLQQAQAGLLRTLAGPAGGAASSVLGVVYDIGSRATAIGSDLTNQMGWGTGFHPTSAGAAPPQADRRPTAATTSTGRRPAARGAAMTRARPPRRRRPRQHRPPRLTASAD